MEHPDTWSGRRQQAGPFLTQDRPGRRGREGCPVREHPRPPGTPSGSSGKKKSFLNSTGGSLVLPILGADCPPSSGPSGGTRPCPRGVGMGKNRRAWKGWGGALAFATAACFGGVEAPPGAEHPPGPGVTLHLPLELRSPPRQVLLALQPRGGPSRPMAGGGGLLQQQLQPEVRGPLRREGGLGPGRGRAGRDLKVTGGVILGYKGQYQNKIPYNHDGVAPGLLPSLGYQRGPWNAQLNVLGFAGLVVTVGYDLARW